MVVIIGTNAGVEQRRTGPLGSLRVCQPATIFSSLRRWFLLRGMMYVVCM
jgi:hypothetical protein